MQQVHIRKAYKEDFKFVQQLCDELIKLSNKFDPNYNINWSFEPAGIKYITSRMRGRKYICLVAILNEEIIGYLTGAVLKMDAWRPIKRVELENLYIKSNYRKMGIGTNLKQEFIKWAKLKGAKRCTVIALAKDEHAISFYKKNEFSPLHLKLEAII
jgi:GNAT superfamily N-acetyltransferase